MAFSLEIKALLLFLFKLVVIGFADALWDYVSSESDELSFSAGDTIAVTEMTDEEWWGGFIEDRQGWFPKNYVRVRLCSMGEK